ncbi:MAG: hypothetical protein APR55_05020 [Methanolinea sp. SDB]|nr:MAG: hypothetical protein APR55_05020 [Methanolinea sp. SDB]
MFIDENLVVFCFQAPSGSLKLSDPVIHRCRRITLSNSKVKIPSPIYECLTMRLACTRIYAIILLLAVLGLPATADDCGCNSGWDDGTDEGASGSGNQDTGAGFGDDDTSDSWDVTDSSWYSDLSGGDDPDTGGSTESSDSSDYSGDFGSSGSTVADGSAEDAQVWYAKARDYYEGGLYNESLTAFNTSLSLDPFNKRIWTGKGELLMRLGYYEAAAEAFQQVAKLDPAEYEAYFMIGEAFFRLGRLEDSIAMYDRALTVNPRFDSAEYQKRLVQEVMAGIGASEEESSTAIGGEPSAGMQTPATIAPPGDIGTSQTTLAASAGIMPHHILLGICIFSLLMTGARGKR